MSVNFPLILVLATAFTGAVWMLEHFLLAPRRGDDGDAEQPLIVEYSISFFPVLAIVLVLRSFLFEPFQIPTGSMIPTLEIGDFILVNKHAYGIRLPVIGTRVIDVGEPENGDVMVFIPPHVNEYYIKRVIGTPGDRIRYEDKVLYINGEKQAQTFVAQYPPQRPKLLVYDETINGSTHEIHRNAYRDTRAQEWVVPEGYYFMMGDNRDQSNDSRYWGFVSEDMIIGKAVAVWMHKDPGLKLPNFSQNGWIE